MQCPHCGCYIPQDMCNTPDGFVMCPVCEQDVEELISRDQLRAALDKYYDSAHVQCKNTFCEGMRLAISTCIKLVDAQPAVSKEG